ncbi:MAG: hypothetical protein ACXABO_01985 [Promethearchaeota archaeon]|jgi:hypothetical protein
MGFKKVDQDELKTKIGPNFLGIPIREGGKIVQKSHREKKIESGYMGEISEVLILNEEFLDYHYQNDGKRKSIVGNGNISIFNNSVKDRIWDANLQFSGSQFDNNQEENNLDLGIFEPNSNKVLNYEIVNSEELPDLIEVNENIENLSEAISEDKGVVKSEEGLNDPILQNELDSEFLQKTSLLLLGRENKVKFSITVKNISKTTLEKIKFTKFFPEAFYDLEFECRMSKEFKITRTSVECSLNNLNPGDQAEITIQANIFPKRKEDVRTGNMEIKFNLSHKVISGIKVNHFSAYSHAMHAIKKVEKDYAPNHWQCSLIFENHSDFRMKLNNILIYDKSKSKKILDLNIDSSNNMVILPRGKFTTEYFDFIDAKEPTFSRKVEYTVDYKNETHSMISSNYDENTFKIANIAIKKKLSEGEIKSFEETTLNSKIAIKNEGTIPIKGFRIKERVPEDFLPPRNISEYKLYRSSGEIDLNDIELKLTPDDDDPSREHIIELLVNLKTDNIRSVIEVEDFLEIKYPLKAITPDYKKAYDFPLYVDSYYHKYVDTGDIKEYYVIMSDLSKIDQSTIKISHKRRKLMIGKEIFPGRSVNEFAIYIIAKNGSNIKLNDVNITDTFPDSFELISSSFEHKVTKVKNNGGHKISFNIDNILPYQEREIMYYLKNISGKDIKQSELESFFVG